MQNQIQKLFLRDALKRQQIILTSVVLFILGVMSLSIIEVTKAANNATSNGTQNVTAGTLAIDNAPANLNFPDSAPGTNNSNYNISTDGVVTNDTRGTLAGWTLYGFWQTNWLKSTDANIQMSMNNDASGRMTWLPSDATVTNVTGDSGGATAGANNNFGGISSSNNLTLVQSNNSADNNGAGAYNMTNLVFQYDITTGAQTGNYTTTLNLTIT